MTIQIKGPPCSADGVFECTQSFLTNRTSITREIILVSAIVTIVFNVTGKKQHHRIVKCLSITQKVADTCDTL